MSALPDPPNNPFTPLLLSNSTPQALISSYETHRTTRNASQWALHLAPGFRPTLDTILQSILTAHIPDPRHCLVLWSRPPSHIIDLIIEIQRRLAEHVVGANFDSIKEGWRLPLPSSSTTIASKSDECSSSHDDSQQHQHEQEQQQHASPPELLGGPGSGGVWWMPASHLHMTVLEAIHSVTSSELAAVLSPSSSSSSSSSSSASPKSSNGYKIDPPIKTLLQKVADIPSHLDGGGSSNGQETPSGGGRVAPPVVALTSPRVCFDGSALAVGFLPEYSPAEYSSEEDEQKKKEWYSYHHLRESVFSALANPASPSSSSSAPKIPIASRYVVPSAHVTIMRYTSSDIIYDGGVEGWMQGIEAVNKWLEEEWDSVRWVVAEEKGLEWRVGRVWYGGGETVVVGRRAGAA